MSREQQRASRESKKNAVRNDISRRIFCFAPVAISWLLPFQSRRNSRRESIGAVLLFPLTISMSGVRKGIARSRCGFISKTNSLSPLRDCGMA
jgi:hypothetical protein